MSIEAMKLMVAEMEYVFDCINKNKMPFDGDDFHEALRLGRQSIEHQQERCVGCEACIESACGREDCPKGWKESASVAYIRGLEDGMRQAIEQAQKQSAERVEPVAYLYHDANSLEELLEAERKCLNLHSVLISIRRHEAYRNETPLYTSPPQRQPLWIDTNDKTQERFLPNIGEPVLFCHDGKTYYGKHNGGSFQRGAGITKQYFNTWECHWMPIPAAHGIKGE